MSVPNTFAEGAVIGNLIGSEKIGRVEPGQDEIGAAIFLALSPQEFPRTALRKRGRVEKESAPYSASSCLEG